MGTGSRAHTNLQTHQAVCIRHAQPAAGRHSRLTKRPLRKCRCPRGRWHLSVSHGESWDAVAGVETSWRRQRCLQMSGMTSAWRTHSLHQQSRRVVSSLPNRALGPGDEVPSNLAPSTEEARPPGTRHRRHKAGIRVTGRRAPRSTVHRAAPTLSPCLLQAAGVSVCPSPSYPEQQRPCTQHPAHPHWGSTHLLGGKEVCEI